MGLMESGYVWIVTDAIAAQPDVLSNDGVYLASYRGLIGLRPAAFDERSAQYRTFVDGHSLHNGHVVDELVSYGVMAYDAIGMVQSVLDDLETMPTPNIDCEIPGGWEFGETVLSALLNVNYAGITGQTTFTERGESRKVVYDIVNFNDDGFQIVGSWHTSCLQLSEPMKFLGSREAAPSGVANSMEGAHLKLGVLPEGPFSYQTVGTCEGNACWTGICPDIVSRLSTDLGFTYEYLTPRDGKWGGYNKSTQQWDGMISELISGRIDMIAMHLTIDSAREEVIDFSTPFLETEIAAVAKKDSGSRNGIFFFLSSFSEGVWLCIVAANCVTTLMIWLFSKISPFDKSWAKVHAMKSCLCQNCTARKMLREATKTATFECLVQGIADSANNGDISFYESAWVTSTGLVAKISKILPYSLPARFLLFVWWFFMLLIISIYTANLTAFLTLNNMEPLTDIKHLLYQVGSN